MNAERKPDLIGPAESILLRIPAIRGALVRHGLERILYTTTYEFPTDYNETIKYAALDGFTFLVIANHESHADIPPASYVTWDIRTKANQFLPQDEQIPGFVLPFSPTVGSGTQGSLLKNLYGDIKPVLDRFPVEPAYTATENDVTHRGATENRIGYTRQMIDSVRKNKSILLFPEGRVEGGRRDESGKLPGMQKFESSSIHQALRIQTMVYKGVLVVPVGISGGYKVYEPKRKRLPLGTFTVGLGLSYENLMNVRVGEPIIFTKSEIKSMDPNSLDLEMAGRIARLLPPEERGKYKYLVA